MELDETSILMLSDADETVELKAVKTNVRFTSVCCGPRHFLALDTEGCLYGAGWNRHGQVCHVKKEVSPLTLLHSSLKFKDMACGMKHSVALTIDERVMTWGSNSKTQLFDDTNSLSGVSVHSGWQMTAVMTQDRKSLSMSGASHHGQMGGLQIASLLNADETIEQVALGSEHGLVLTSHSRVFAWGWNEHGNLGLKDCEDRPAPELVRTDFNVSLIACGYGFTFFKRHDDNK
jgi:alpha-tubulin suppressor-like RCC1 family protein